MAIPKKFPAHKPNEQWIPFSVKEYSSAELELIPKLTDYKPGDLGFIYNRTVWELCDKEV